MYCTNQEKRKQKEREESLDQDASRKKGGKTKTLKPGPRHDNQSRWKKDLADFFFSKKSILRQISGCWE